MSQLEIDSINKAIQSIAYEGHSYPTSYSKI